MIAFIFLFVATLVNNLVSGAAVQPNDNNASIPEGMIPGEMLWRGNLTVDGPIHEFNGTIQEIYAQIMKANPNYELMEVSHHHHSSSPHQLSITNIQCMNPFDSWGYALGTAIEDGIKYLKGVHGGCGMGPKVCGRISCSWNSAIWWCNNNDDFYSRPCSYFADYAQAVRDHCEFRPNEVWGQAFDTDGFSVFCAGKDHYC